MTEKNKKSVREKKKWIFLNFEIRKQLAFSSFPCIHFNKCNERAFFYLPTFSIYNFRKVSNLQKVSIYRYYIETFPKYGYSIDTWKYRYSATLSCWLTASSKVVAPPPLYNFHARQPGVHWIIVTVGWWLSPHASPHDRYDNFHCKNSLSYFYHLRRTPTTIPTYQSSHHKWGSL